MVQKLLLIATPFLYLIVLLFQKDLGLLEDLGRHLKVGEIVLSCKCVPQTNLFSYVSSDFPIVNHEWLSQVILFLLYKNFGLQSLLIFKITIFLLVFILLYKISIKYANNFWVMVFLTLSIAVVATRFRVRPEMFSYLFIALFFYLIEKYKSSKNIYYLYLLPLIELAWVNMHIFFILGIGIYFSYLLELLLINKKNISKQLIIVSVLLVLAPFINPSIIHGALLPFTIFHNYDISVEENKNPFEVFNMNTATFIYTLRMQVFLFEFLALFFFFVFLFKKTKKNISYYLNGVFASILGLLMTRNISLLGIFSVVSFSEKISYVESALRKKNIQLSNILRGFTVLFLAIFMYFHIKGLYDNKVFSFSYENYAENAGNFLANNKIEGNIFNNYRIGNYLIYRLYPQKKVYIDARPESYPPGFFKDYNRMLQDPEFFNTQVKKYDINAVVMGVADEDPTVMRPFLLGLLSNPEWVPVYGDGYVTILIKNSEENKEIIDKFKISIN